MSKIQVPEHLAPATQAWFKRVTKDYHLEPHHVRLLTLACEHYDRGVAAREILEKEGLTFPDRFDCPRPRPEVKIAHDATIAFTRILRELSLDTDAPPDSSRPPRIAGRY